MEERVSSTPKQPRKRALLDIFKGLGVFEWMAAAAFLSAVLALAHESSRRVEERHKEQRNVKAREGMVYIPAGEFLRGSDDVELEHEGDYDNFGHENEKPVKKIYMSPFWIDVYEVTAGEYAACVKAGRCTAPVTTGQGCEGEAASWRGGEPRRDRARHPVNCVTWEQASAYCAWAGKALPTEAQWEKAARGSSTDWVGAARRYPWGDDKASCDEAVMEGGCGRGGPWPVGSRPAGVSPYGAHDMSGNVVEWVNDWYDERSYASSALVDPAGPTQGATRVVRGGGWRSSWEELRVTHRRANAPTSADHTQGFRCAKPSG
jgi:formylglycine-generating enzyme required for sulfatase activity